MIRIGSIAEKNINVSPPNIITLAAATATKVFDDVRYVQREIAARWLQNLTGANLYLSFGISDGATPPGPVCDATLNYHTVIADLQLIELPGRVQVNVYSASGGKISVIENTRRVWEGV